MQTPIAAPIVGASIMAKHRATLVNTASRTVWPWYRSIAAAATPRMPTGTATARHARMNVPKMTWRVRSSIASALKREQGHGCAAVVRGQFADVLGAWQFGRDADMQCGREIGADIDRAGRSGEDDVLQPGC